MAKVIRMGLIGCGKMMAAHAKNLNLVEEIEIVACCDLYRDKQTQYEIRHFAQCVNDGTLPLTNGRAALRSLRVIRSLYNAEKNGFIADLRGLGIPEEYQVE